MKRIFLVVLIYVIFLGCAKEVLKEPPLKYSAMPSFLEFDSLSSPPPSTPGQVIDSSLVDFKSRPIDEGDTCPVDGILVSERRYAEYVFYKSGYERLATELGYCQYLGKEYYNKAKATEVVYQNEIIRLRKEAKRSWLEKNIPYISFFGGVLSTVLAELAIVKLID